MPIDIVGQATGRERAAAERLRELIEPALRKEDQVSIVVGAKCYGQQRQDIDLIVMGTFGQGFLVPREAKPDWAKSTTVYLSSLALLIEVKDHDQAGVRFTGPLVDVRYKEGWVEVSKTVHEQVHSIKSYLEENRLSSPFWTGLIWLRGVHRSALPSSVHNVLPADLTWLMLLRTIVANRLRKPADGKSMRYLTVSAGKTESMRELHAVLEIFTRRIEPSVLDRKKVEAICARLVRNQQYSERLGQQLLIFRGRGGAGKTIRLLQLGRSLYEEHDCRVLFLTYNKALVADVRRLLAVLGVGDKLDASTMRIQTSDSYFWSLLKAFDMQPKVHCADVFPAVDYEHRKAELLALLRTTTAESLRGERVFADFPRTFQWDYVFVDEAQDWPAVERDLLDAVFGARRLVIADGVDQFVRGENRCDWAQLSAPSDRQIVTLKKSLRLKANLCSFAQGVASELGTRWDMDVNGDMPGGRILILRRPYDREVHEYVFDRHASLGNLPLDALFCVTGTPGAVSLGLTASMTSWGHEVWDGTTSEGRTDFPTSVDQYRVVKYESCRGLEGWTVVCLDLNVFLERQLRIGMNVERDLLTSPSEAAAQFAARWCMIPLTRAVDTLVLQLGGNDAFSEAILNVGRQYKDFMELID